MTATLNINSALNGIEISFDSKPDQAIIDGLKNLGYRWHNVKKLWYAKNTPERLTFAESITSGKTESKTEKKEAVKILSLWDRCKVDDIQEHSKAEETKTIAAETRKHIKERFPEIKFSCRIGSGGWAACNEINFYFQSAPYAKDSAYMEAIKKYVKAWLLSYNYDNSDSMTDYFDRGFYETVDFWNFEKTEPTTAQLEDMADFDAEAEKARQEEEKRQEEEYQKYLIEQEENKKRWEAQEKIDRANREEIAAHVQIVNLEDNEKYILSGSMLCGCGKENNIFELQESGNSKEERAIIKREIYFTDEKIYNNFCNMFLHDFDFLAGFGGTGTLDNRVTDDNFNRLNAAQRESVKWILWDCVAVYLNNELRLVIDPEGYSYARYVNIVSADYQKTLLQSEEKQEQEAEKEGFYFPEKIAEQAQTLEEGKQYTIIYIDSLSMVATMHHITLNKKAITRYAQYENSLYLEYVEAGKRKAQAQYFHDGNRILIYSGFLPDVPTELKREYVSGNMYRVKNAGMGVDKFMVDIFKYYKNCGFMPEINTLQF